MTTAPAALRANVLDQAGQAWLLAGDPVRAYAAAGQAFALQPNDPELLLDRAEAAASARYFDQAIADLDHVLKADPDRIEALIYRASAYRALDRLDPALADVEKALARRPTQCRPYSSAAISGGWKAISWAPAATGKRSARSPPAARPIWRLRPISSI